MVTWEVLIHAVRVVVCSALITTALALLIEMTFLMRALFMLHFFKFQKPDTASHF